MTLKQYNKLRKVVDKALKELKEQAIKNGTLMSENYEYAVLELKKTIVEKAGFVLEDYQGFENMDEGTDMLEYVNEVKNLKEEFRNLKIPQSDEIHKIAKEEAKKAVDDKPPKIINRIVKEITKPQIIKETQIKIDENDLKELKKDLTYLQGEFSEFINTTTKEFSTFKKTIPREDKILEIVDNFKRWGETDDKLGLIRQTISRMSWGFDEQIKTLQADLTKESLWDRTVTTLSPQTANDNLDMGSGNFTTTGTGTFENITIFSAIPILVFKDSTYVGDTSLGYIEWRDSNNTRLGFFGNSSSGNDDLYWRNESSGGHIKIETTGAGDFVFTGGTIRTNKIDSPPITDSYRSHSFIPVITADNYETPFYWERATAPLTTPTSDASGDCLHPDVVYIPGGWNGYTYWMVMTPFTGSNTDVENPEILVSNDGESWSDPGTNPIDPDPGGTAFHSDPSIMFYQNTLYAYWRLADSGDGDHILGKTSTDGVNWSDEIDVLDAGGTTGGTLASPIVRNIYGTFYMWTVDTDASPNELHLRTSSSPTSGWSAPTTCTLTFGGAEEIFHINIMWDGDAFYCIWTPPGSLFFGKSYDGENWDMGGVPLVGITTGGEWDENKYQSALIRRPGRNYFDVFYSAYETTGVNLHRIGRGKLHWTSGDDVGNLYGYVNAGSGGRYISIKDSILRIRSDGTPYMIIGSLTDDTDATDDPRIFFQHGATPATKTVMGVDASDSSKFKIAPSALATNAGFIMDSTGDVTLGQDAIIFGAGLAANIVNTWNSSTNDGVLTWVYASDYFQFSDDVVLTAGEKLGVGTVPTYILDATGSHQALRLHRDVNNEGYSVWADWALDNDAGQVTTYARVSGTIVDNTDGTEDGALALSTMKDGTVTKQQTLDENGFWDVMKVTGGTQTGYLGIGTAANSSYGIKLEHAILLFHGVDTSASGALGGAGLQWYCNDGAAMASGDRLGYIIFGGAEDASDTLSTGASIQGFATENWGAAANGGELQFYTTTNTAASATLKMTLQNDGNLGIGVADPHSKLEVAGAISSATATITASSDTTDVSGINTLFINITGDIVLGGLVGGVNGQTLNIVMLGNFINHVTLEHAEGIGGSQDFINHTGVDEDISHGGSIYVCNGTNWYDTSHAKHV